MCETRIKCNGRKTNKIGMNIAPKPYAILLIGEGVLW